MMNSHAIGGRGEQGFTLIETVIVIALAGLLATIGVIAGVDEQRQLASTLQAEDRVVSEIRRARSVSASTLPRTSGRIETADLAGAAGADFAVDPVAMDLRHGKYSSEGVDGVTCRSGSACQAGAPPFEVSIRALGQRAETTRYLCVSKVTARIQREACR